MEEKNKLLYSTQDLVQMLSLFVKNEIYSAVKNGELKTIRRGNKFLFKKNILMIL